MHTVGRWALLLAVCTLFIGGCAAMSKKECLNVDWSVRGHADGSEGRPSSRVDAYVKACGRHDIQVHVDQYEAGRRKGVEMFCTRENGFAAALTGYRDVGACTPDNVEQFLSGYRPGTKMYAANERVRDARRTISRSASLIESNRNEIVRIYKRLGEEADLSEDKTNELRRRAERLENQISEAQGRIINAQSRLPTIVQECFRTKAEMEEAGFDPNVNC